MDQNYRKKNGLIRSMSNKGNTPDNAACEGVFGRIKNECFYNQFYFKTHISSDKTNSPIPTLRLILLKASLLL